MGSTRFLLFVIVLISLPLVSCKKKSSASSSQRVRQVVKGVPDLQMKKMKVEFYGDSGLEWDLQSPLAEGFRGGKLMWATDLTIQLYDTGEKSSTIMARKGILNTEKVPEHQVTQPVRIEEAYDLHPGDMLLRGDVVILSTDGAKMETDYLYYDSRADLVTSTAPVRLERPDSITTGVGMEAKPDLSNVEIFNQTVIIQSDDEEDELEKKPDEESE